MDLKVVHPQTGRKVRVGGRLGHSLLRSGQVSHVENPATGRKVAIHSRLGRNILPQYGGDEIEALKKEVLDAINQIRKLSEQSNNEIGSGKPHSIPDDEYNQLIKKYESIAGKGARKLEKLDELPWGIMIWMRNLDIPYLQAGGHVTHRKMAMHSRLGRNILPQYGGDEIEALKKEVLDAINQIRKLSEQSNNEIGSGKPHSIPDDEYNQLIKKYESIAGKGARKLEKLDELPWGIMIWMRNLDIPYLQAGGHVTHRKMAMHSRLGRNILPQYGGDEIEALKKEVLDAINQIRKLSEQSNNEIGSGKPHSIPDDEYNQLIKKYESIAGKGARKLEKLDELPWGIMIWMRNLDIPYLQAGGHWYEEDQ